MRRRDRAQLAALGGGLTYPQIVIGEQVVDGFSELRRLDREGALRRITAGWSRTGSCRVGSPASPGRGMARKCRQGATRG